MKSLGCEIIEEDEKRSDKDSSSVGHSEVDLDKVKEVKLKRRNTIGTGSSPLKISNMRTGSLL